MFPSDFAVLTIVSMSRSRLVEPAVRMWRRSWEKGSPSVLVLCTDGGLEAVSMAGSPRRMVGSVEERTGVGALASAAGERREEKGAEG